MGKVKLYIASSLDGYIARPQGEVDWLESHENPNQLDYGFHDFYNSCGITLMGNKTYKEILGYDIDFPYKGKKNYVATKNTFLSQDENVSYINTNLEGEVANLKKEAEDIWLIGGGILIKSLYNAGLIDEMLIFIMPVIIGKGIDLFPEGLTENNAKLIDSETYPTGVVRLHYEIQSS
jgi:dihydrofolate reductase